MKEYLPKNLIALAEACSGPLYLVGGSVRDFLCGRPITPSTDFDLASPMPEDDLLSAARRCGLAVKSVYRNTGTVKLCGPDNVGYEFTRFRTDKYVRGMHAPAEIAFTDDIATDARRRDFCADAVYYEIKKGEYADPLGGIADIRKKILRTVAPASKVFGEDGLRLMRLARIAAQTGFSPDEECLAGAKEHSALIRDIVPERIFSELLLLLRADEKHGDRTAVYRGLCILRDTGVLKEILPELALGEGMAQRPAFHDHDVLEHSLRCAMYAPAEVRLAALLHDAGKPFCYLRDGNYYAHAEEGEHLARAILTRFKAPKKLTEEVCALVRLHMRDYDLQMREGKLRREFVQNYPLLPKLFFLKQADYSACKDDLCEAPVLIKWNALLEKMKSEGVPFTLPELAVNGDDLLAAGVAPQEVGKTLGELLFACAQDGKLNTKEKLLKRLARMDKRSSYRA